MGRPRKHLKIMTSNPVIQSHPRCPDPVNKELQEKLAVVENQASAQLQVLREEYEYLKLRLAALQRTLEPENMHV